LKYRLIVLLEQSHRRSKHDQIDSLIRCYQFTAYSLITIYLVTQSITHRKKFVID